MTQFDDAIAHAQAHEVAWTRDPHAEPLRYGVHHDDPPPWNRLHGPVHARGPVSGQIWIGGELRQSWGEPERADQTFSVAKTYLALLAGVAHGRGLLPDPDERVVQRVPGIGFDSEHNRPITWAHLLGQTSEWEGSCFGIPDQVDRYRKLALDPKPVQGQKGDDRPLQAPGTYWEYNDVRINQLSLALLHLFGQALPEVFEQSILHPIGGGEGFRWEGYAQSWVDLPARAGQAAQRVASVPGGSHWGGGCASAPRTKRALPNWCFKKANGQSTVNSVLWCRRPGWRACASRKTWRRFTAGSIGSTPKARLFRGPVRQANSCSVPGATMCGSSPPTKRWWWCAGSNRRISPVSSAAWRGPWPKSLVGVERFVGAEVNAAGQSLAQIG